MENPIGLPAALAIAAIAALPGTAHSEGVSSVGIGAILDGRYQDGTRAFSEIDEGFGLGHTELSLFGNIDDRFRGVLTAVIETAHDETELEIEEAFVEAFGLGTGLNVRAGRMLSGFGYLNGRHLHEDDFSDRPAVYRTYLGGHYYDDGVATNLVIPTERYISISLEAFDREKLAAPGTRDEDFGTINAWGGQIKFGADAGQSSSWQVGLSFLDNDNGIATEHGIEGAHGHHEREHEHDEHEDVHEVEHALADAHDEEHDHDHGPEVTGGRLTGIDFTWKWAPNGNSKNRNLTLSAEYLRLDDLLDEELSAVPGAPDRLDGWYISAAYQISPRWTVGLRYGEVETYHGHLHHDEHGIEGNYDTDETTETDLSLAWHPSHFSTVRTTYTRQEQRVHGTSHEENIFVLQYVMSLGAHSAHTY